LLTLLLFILFLLKYSPLAACWRRLSLISRRLWDFQNTWASTDITHCSNTGHESWVFKTCPWLIVVTFQNASVIYKENNYPLRHTMIYIKAAATV